MPLYEVTSDNLTEIARTTFDQAGLRERTDLQRLLKRQIEVILPDTLVLAEEFGEWEDSKRRIDLLGLDKNANLVVIELKRTDDGGHMELQAIRYAAMVSTMTFDKVVDIYSRHWQSSNDEAQAAILDFLEWDDTDADSFAQDVKIVLVSANFSKELTTAVMWLNKRDLDIRCIRLVPYQDNGRTLIDVQQVIPLPEAAEYQIKIREKEQRERKEKAADGPFLKFWEGLLASGENSTPLHSKMSPYERGYMGAGSGTKGLTFYYAIARHSNRVELYIDRGSSADNKRIFDELFSQKVEIENAFSEPLSWERRDTGRASRVAYIMTLGGYKDDEAIWPAIQTAMIKAMVRFEKALTPFIAKLKP